MKKREKSNWDAIKAMRDADAEDNALADPNNLPTDSAFWAEVELQEPDSRKVPVHIRIAPDILEFFKKDGPGYQTRINHVLEQYVNWQQQHRS